MKTAFLLFAFAFFSMLGFAAFGQVEPWRITTEQVEVVVIEERNVYNPIPALTGNVLVIPACEVGGTRRQCELTYIGGFQGWQFSNVDQLPEFADAETSLSLSGGDDEINIPVAYLHAGSTLTAYCDIRATQIGDTIRYFLTSVSDCPSDINDAVPVISMFNAPSGNYVPNPAGADLVALLRNVQ